MKIRVEVPGYLFYDRPSFIQRIAKKLERNYGADTIKFTARLYGLLRRELGQRGFRVDSDRHRLLLEITPISAPKPAAIVVCEVYEVPKGKKSDKRREAGVVAEYRMKPLVSFSYKVEL